MNERYITLMGSEQVQSAAGQMQRAAEDMRQASRNFDDAMQRHQRFMDDWLQRFEAALSAKANP